MPKSITKQALLIIIFVGFALCLVAILFILLKSPNQDKVATFVRNSPTQNQQKTLHYGVPIRLKIPKINADAAVEYVGLNPQGEMDIPKNPNTVAWFHPGPRPGEIGSAVIDGHFGLANDKPAIFDNLDALKEGDQIQVKDKNGTTITFIVRELRKYSPIEDTTDVFTSNDGKAHLNLITCNGAWNKSQKSYSDRLVVFADKKM